MSGRLNRRDFIGGVGLASGGLVVSMAVPWAEAVEAARPTLARLSDWSIDDMWGVYPRYAEPIAYGRTRAPVATTVGSIDAL
jgi:hypothetical protein